MRGWRRQRAVGFAAVDPPRRRRDPRPSTTHRSGYKRCATRATGASSVADLLARSSSADLLAECLQQNGVRRADFLAPRFDPERVLENVTGVTLALPDELRESVARQLVAVGYEREDAQGSVRLRGRDWSLTLVPAASERPGIVGLELATTRGWDGPSPVRLGSGSLLVFEAGRRATWAFR